MKIPLSDVIDRITILNLKIEHSDDSCFKKELAVCQKAVQESKNQGASINQEWIDELQKINRFQWGLESEFKELKDNNKKCLEALGRKVIELCISNKKRTAVKNKIVEETGSGFRDIKTN